MSESSLYKELGILTKKKDQWEENIPYISSLLSHDSVKIQAKALLPPFLVQFERETGQQRRIMRSGEDIIAGHSLPLIPVSLDTSWAPPRPEVYRFTRDIHMALKHDRESRPKVTEISVFP